MKLRIIFLSFISLSLIASQPAQSRQKHDALASGDRGALIAEVLKLKRPVTPTPPRFREATIEETEEWRKAHYSNGKLKYDPLRGLSRWDFGLAYKQLDDMNRPGKAAYDFAMCIYKVKLDIHTIERKKYLEVLEGMFDRYSNVSKETQSKAASAK